MKIGLDFDGVFCNSAKLLSDGAKKLFGVHLCENETTQKVAVEKGILTNSQFEKLKEFVFEDLNQDLKLKPVRGVDTACRSLINAGHDLEIVTKRDRGTKIAENFLRELGLKIPVKGLKPRQPKSSVASRFDIFLDDSLSNLLDLRGLVPSLFLFSWSYNTDADSPATISIRSWFEFVRMIG